MLTIYPITLWSQNVPIGNFWSDMNFPKRIINSFQTSRNKLAKLSIRKLTLTSETLYIQFHDVGTYELLPISQKPPKISNWNFTCILQRHIGIKKYQYLNFDQVPHSGPKSHGWSHMFCMFDKSWWTLKKCWNFMIFLGRALSAFFYEISQPLWMGSYFTCMFLMMIQINSASLMKYGDFWKNVEI